MDQEYLSQSHLFLLTVSLLIGLLNIKKVMGHLPNYSLYLEGFKPQKKDLNFLQFKLNFVFTLFNIILSKIKYKNKLKKFKRFVKLKKA